MYFPYQRNYHFKQTSSALSQHPVHLSLTPSQPANTSKAKTASRTPLHPWAPWRCSLKAMMTMNIYWAPILRQTQHQALHMDLLMFIFLSNKWAEALLLVLFYQRGNWGKNTSNLSKVTQKSQSWNANWWSHSMTCPFYRIIFFPAPFSA